MKPQNTDSNGFELPLKLIITSIILAISIPITLSYWISYDRQQTVNALTTELESLTTHIAQVYDSGLGNSKTVELTIRDGTFSKISYVELGDSNTTSLRAKTMRWKFNDGQEQIKLIADGIPVKSIDGGAFKLKHGLNKLYFETKMSNVLYVEIGFL